MTRPPRDPARRFLDRPELSAIALTATALTAAVLPAYLVAHAIAGTPVAVAAAVAAWLIAHVAVAWTLRADPRLAWARNPAFPAWALTATLTALIFTLTPAAHLLGNAELTLGAFAVTAATASFGAAVALAARHSLRIPQLL
jgi:Ca2+-transporting ATPase